MASTKMILDARLGYTLLTTLNECDCEFNDRIDSSNCKTDPTTHTMYTNENCC